MNIYIGADHRGYQAKKQLVDYLTQAGYTVTDVGNQSLDPNDDFPDFAKALATQLLADQQPDSRGILMCGSGQGMCMAANRFKGIRASLCFDQDEAYSSRHDDNANVLCLKADKLDWDETLKLLDIWLKTNYAAEDRFGRRLNKLDELG